VNPVKEMKKTLFKKIKSAFIFWLARRLPDCKTMTPALSQSLDRRLSPREKIVMRLHLFTCTACTRYLKQIKFLSETIHKHEERLTESDDLSPVQMSAEGKEKLKNALKSAQIFAI
jgi:predicted anti-sigma-YlaC factor YlaD